MVTEKKDTLLRIKYLGINTLVHWFLFCHFQVVPAEASAEVTQNSGDGAEAAASSPKIKRSGSLARPFYQKTNLSTKH